jgi:hypothetical protein
MGLELATESLKGATFSLNENHEHPFLPYGIFAEHKWATLNFYQFDKIRLPWL